MSEHPTDPAYEETRREAEQRFQVVFKDWADELATIVEQARTDPEGIWVSKSGLPGVKGFVIELGNLCCSYAEEELRAFAELLRRRGLPRSQIVTELDKHVQDTLNQIRRWKWEYGVDHIVEELRLTTHGFDKQQWHLVESDILYLFSVSRTIESITYEA